VRFALSASVAEKVAVTCVGAMPFVGVTLSVPTGGASVPDAVTTTVFCADPPAPLEIETVAL
jgi:hypothetical protein